MITKLRFLFLALSLVLTSNAVARHDGGELQGITDDGRRVILKENHKWQFVEVVRGDPETSAVLTILKVEELDTACRMELHLANNLSMKIVHLVPRFGIYNLEGVLFDSASKSFANIKPGRDKYSSIQFHGIGCHQISKIKVYDAARCRMGDIDIWNEEEGQCLSRLYLTPTDLINISK